MNLTLAEIADILNVILKDGGGSQVRDVSIDSRTIQEGMLFFALQGGHHDGHTYVGEAFDKGACAAVVRKGWNPEKSVGSGLLLPVDEPLHALQAVASAYRDRFRIPILSITGSNGKTTTKDMTAAVLGRRYRVMKSQGNYNNHIGVPLSVCGWKSGGELAVLEMGTNHFGEIAKLCRIARPTHGMITNIGKGHLGFFENLEGVARAKGEMVEFLAREGTVFLNGDDPRLKPFRNRAEKCVTFGFSRDCDFIGEKRSPDKRGLPRLGIEGRIISLPIPGSHNLYNALAAACVGRFFEVPWEEIRHALEQFRPPEKRMEMLLRGGVRILNDCYNANPTSMESALDTLISIPIPGQGKRIAVLGDMLELGDTSAAEHRNLGKRVAEMDLDLLLAYGPEMSRTVEAARISGLDRAVHYASHESLIRDLVSFVEEGDIVLVKGSRGTHMEIVVERLNSALPPEDED
jgi:UDP-N-acetylmuramoyl-tripeptide--D-alanyl-D-alanine ligase